MTQLSIPIAKGGKGAIFTIEAEIFSDLPAEVQMEIIGAGFQHFLNAGMSSSDKYPAPTHLSGEELESAKTAALAKAAANLEDLKAGKVKAKYDASKTTSKPSSLEDRKILSEALRQAKVVLKNRARAQGIKQLSLIPASKWTELAQQEVKSNPKYLAQAKETLAEQEKETTELDLKALLVVDPAKAAKAKAKSSKASDNGTLSATQAGKTAPSKGKVPPARPKLDDLAGLVQPGHHPNHASH